MKRPVTVGEALSRLHEAESKLKLLNSRSLGYRSHFGILFCSYPKDTPIDELFKTKAVGGEIDHGSTMCDIVLEQEANLINEIQKHPIKSKRLCIELSNT